MATRKLTMNMHDTPSPAPGWWRRAVVYEIYIRSFADGDGDGIGDIAGIRSRLPYLRDLGVDAIWITPWYPSPMKDGGYDVADYRAIDPLFGTLADAEPLVAEAHAAGIRVLIDLVPNHTSADHAWFREALASPPGSAARARYLFRDGKGPTGDEPPNNWGSVFGGEAWTRTVGPDGRPEQWYLHLFDSSQPDLDWANAEVRAEFESILRFWFDRGVDGFRIDVASGLAKDAGLRDLPPEMSALGAIPDDHPHWDRPEVHGIYRDWHAIAASYPDERVLLGEVHVAHPTRLATFLRPDELHGAFNFHFMRSAFEAPVLQAAIDETIESNALVGSASSWVLSNHDEPRHLSRLGRPMTAITTREVDEALPVDLALGTRRARAALLLLLALPGSVYLYQGEELGLPEVMDLPPELREDPIFHRTGGTILGRDGCRVPLPWSGTVPPFGFGPAGARPPWLPQPHDWVASTAVAQAADPGSMLTLYRGALSLRRAEPGFAGEYFRWVPSPGRTLHFEREGYLRCALNLSSEPMPLPRGRRQLLASVAFDGNELPPDAAVWYVAG